MTGITLHDFARDVAGVMESEGGGPAVVVGHAFWNWVARTKIRPNPKVVLFSSALGTMRGWRPARSFGQG
jgi:hypothetical protein